MMGGEYYRVAEYNRSEKELTRLKKLQVTSSEDKVALKQLNGHFNILSREIAIDDAEKRAVEKSFESYLENALLQYSEVLILSQEADRDTVFQVVNLWLKNIDKAIVISTMMTLFSKCPSYKFVPLQYQIISRLGGSSSESQAVVSEIITKMCSDHPYHTLPQVFAIVNEKFQKCKALQGASRERLLAAERIIDMLGRISRVSGTVRSMSTLLEAYIELAQLSTQKQQDENRYKDISFKDLQGRDRAFSECIKRMHDIPPIISLQPPLV
jgi:ataxia telangiectasia mutated family protein